MAETRGPNQHPQANPPTQLPLGKPRHGSPHPHPGCSASPSQPRLPPLYPYLRHPYLDGEQGAGLEQPRGAGRVGLGVRAALQRVGEGVPAPAAPRHAGVPALGHPLPVGRSTGMLSTQHRGTATAWWGGPGGVSSHIPWLDGAIEPPRHLDLLTASTSSQSRLLLPFLQLGEPRGTGAPSPSVSARSQQGWAAMLEGVSAPVGPISPGYVARVDPLIPFFPRKS